MISRSSLIMIHNETFFKPDLFFFIYIMGHHYVIKDYFPAFFNISPRQERFILKNHPYLKWQRIDCKK